MNLIANVFPKLRTSKNVVRSISKQNRSRVPLEKQRSNWEKTLLKSERRHVYHIYWSLWKKLRLKKFLLVICNIFRLFVNTFTAYDKYSVLNREYLKQPNQMQLSIKTKDFFSIFFAVLKPILSFEYCIVR